MNRKENNRPEIHPCPRCGEAVDWNAEARWKPFCSERCKLIDLGAWLSEGHVIPGEPAPGNNGPDRNDDDS